MRLNICGFADLNASVEFISNWRTCNHLVPSSRVALATSYSNRFKHLTAKTLSAMNPLATRDLYTSTLLVAAMLVLLQFVQLLL